MAAMMSFTALAGVRPTASACAPARRRCATTSASAPLAAATALRARLGPRSTGALRAVPFGLSRQSSSAAVGRSREGMVVQALGVMLTSATDPYAAPLLELTEGSAQLGSAAEADVKLEGTSVEGVHAKVDIKNGRAFLTDLNSEGGTYIDDSKLMSGVAYILGSGSVIRLGGEDSSSGLELLVKVPEVQVSAMDEMLAGAFKSTFTSGATNEVKKLLEDDK